MLNAGITNEKKLFVTDENTAINLHSGALPVFSTPSMIAAMEGCCAESVEPFMESGATTVGIKLDVSHEAATPVGEEITVRSRLADIDGKKLIFEVEAFSRIERIGRGVHERFIVNAERFLSKTNAKYGK
ncbi:MAG: thioesterase family protein [Clostridia bacterium]|nr:thioesterase family protein [Clostridia bacterium]